MSPCNAAPPTGARAKMDTFSLATFFCGVSAFQKPGAGDLATTFLRLTSWGAAPTFLI
jgi:hypothetical protein